MFQELLPLGLLLLSHLLPQILHTSLVRVRDVLSLAVQLSMNFFEECDLFLELLLKFVYFGEILVFVGLQRVYLFLKLCL